MLSGASVVEILPCTIEHTSKVTSFSRCAACAASKGSVSTTINSACLTIFMTLSGSLSCQAFSQVCYIPSLQRPHIQHIHIRMCCTHTRCRQRYVPVFCQDCAHCVQDIIRRGKQASFGTPHPLVLTVFTLQRSFDSVMKVTKPTGLDLF